jgi:putative photosynthetic complex assembly protein 2
MNWLFPISVTAGTTAAVLLLAHAMATTDPFMRSADLLVSALLSLAVLEHWFLMYPFGESALWSRALAPAPKAQDRADTRHIQVQKSASRT